MKLSEIEKFQFSNSFVSWKKFASTVSGNIQKSQYSISFTNWKKLRNPSRATLTNLNFHIFLWIRKKFEVQPKTQIWNSPIFPIHERDGILGFWMLPETLLAKFSQLTKDLENWNFWISLNFVFCQVLRTVFRS